MTRRTRPAMAERLVETRALRGVEDELERDCAAFARWCGQVALVAVASFAVRWVVGW